jgi:hypothetical protein
MADAHGFAQSDCRKNLPTAIRIMNESFNRSRLEFVVNWDQTTAYSVFDLYSSSSS